MVNPPSRQLASHPLVYSLEHRRIICHQLLLLLQPVALVVGKGNGQEMMDTREPISPYELQKLQFFGIPRLIH